MAALQYRNETYRVIFRYQGKQQSFTIGKVSSGEAATKCAQVDYLLMRLRQNLAVLPAGMDIVEYVQFDGQKPPVEDPLPAPAKLTLQALQQQYLATHENSLEASTLATLQIHFRHFARHFGDSFPIADLTLADLQGYVDGRMKPHGKKARKVSATTIKKEIVSLRTAWNWAARMDLVSGRFPNEGLRYPKTTEKPPFQTLAEIERQINAGGLSEAQQAELYDSLYLQIGEISELLRHVEAHAAHGFIYSMFCLAAHTGARRSELLRLKVADVDLEGQILTIHERKRVKGRETTRRVPMSEFLVEVMQEWLSHHPGGSWLFCHETIVNRSRKRSSTTGHLGQKKRSTKATQRQAGVHQRKTGTLTPLTKDEAHDHFKRTLSNSQWNVLKGWHVLRHSFVSACANRGIDQRLVETWAGHMSQEMSRRYSHMYPSTQREALSAIFGASHTQHESQPQTAERSRKTENTRGVEGDRQSSRL